MNMQPICTGSERCNMRWLRRLRARLLADRGTARLAPKHHAHTWGRMHMNKTAHEVSVPSRDAVWR